MEELLRLNQVVTLLSIGDVEYDTLNYLKAHRNIQILEMFTKYYKKREKGLGLKIKIKLKGKAANSIVYGACAILTGEKKSLEELFVREPRER